MLEPGQLREFAERGFVVIPQAVPAELVVAASRAIDALTEREPPGDGVKGNHFYFRPAADAPALMALLADSPAWSLAESLTGPETLDQPSQVQVALNIPPFPHRPGGHHIDGYPPGPDGRPGTFTLLAGVMMSDQLDEDAGNLWAWPGTHLTHAEYFRSRGPDAFFAAAGYPPIDLPDPEQIRGRAGDLLLAHYLLGHNIGGNTSDTVRRAVYFRVKRAGHDARWREFLQDPWLDYDPIRARRPAGPIPPAETEERPMATPPRLIPLLKQFDWARKRLADRMAGPAGDSGDGVSIEITGLTDDEYLWEPVPGCWSIRPRAAGPGPGATVLAGAGDWGRDSALPAHPWPPPFTTIAWRLGHLAEMLTLRADHTIGSHTLTRDDYRFSGDAAGALAAFDTGAAAWRAALVSVDDAALDRVGLSTYPNGSDPDDPFIDTVWWVNQELLHHGAEIALLRDLYRARPG